MSEKFLIPEEVLSDVSGGAFSYQGQQYVRVRGVGSEGLVVETEGGTMYFPWNDTAKAELGDGSTVDPIKAVELYRQGWSYPLEELTGSPSPYTGQALWLVKARNSA